MGNRIKAFVMGAMFALVAGAHYGKGAAIVALTGVAFLLMLAVVIMEDRES